MTTRRWSLPFPAFIKSTATSCHGSVTGSCPTSWHVWHPLMSNSMSLATKPIPVSVFWFSLYPNAFHVPSSLCKHVLAESQSDNLAVLSGHMLEVPISYFCMPYLPVSRGRSIKLSEFSSFPGLLPKFSRLLLLLLSALEVLPLSYDVPFH